MSTIIDVPQPADGAATTTAAWKRFIIPVITMVVGLSILLYPVVATMWNNHHQQKATEMYRELVEDIPEEERADIIEQARRYSYENRNGPILDPWLNRVSDDNVEYQEYLTQLARGPIMAQVTIPELDINLPLYHGTTEEVLQKGLGHLYGSALPVGGEGLHSVITGHTGLTHSSMFDNLADIENGDAVYINVMGEMLKYEVHGTEVVLPNETDSLAAVDGEDLLTLITCTPYGINTHRLLVHAHRVPMDPSEADVFDNTRAGLQWWMWLALAVAAAAIITAVVRMRKSRQAIAAAGVAEAGQQEEV